MTSTVETNTPVRSPAASTYTEPDPPAYRWRWVVLLYGTAIALTIIATGMSLFLDHGSVHRGDGLLIAACGCVLGAVALHQFPALRIWVRRNDAGSR